MKTNLKEYPSKMRALVLSEFDKSPEVQEVDVPTPGAGQLLIKIDSSPVNPSDFMFLKGLYSSKKQLPVVAGFEGSGLVVATGNDFFSSRLLGKNVACFAPQDGDGTWAEYMITSYKMAVPLKPWMDIEQGSMLLVNPLSALAMIKIAKKAGVQAIANTAAASALGQMLNRMCAKEGISIVNIVRREEQVALLKSQGATYVLNSATEDYLDSMKSLFKTLNVGIVFDAISGDGVNHLLNALPRNGEVIIYGALSQQEAKATPGNFIFQGKRIRGFWLSEWITQQNILKLLSMFGKIQKFLKDTHQTSIHKRASLDEAVDGISLYMNKMTAGKVIIKPWK